MLSSVHDRQRDRAKRALLQRHPLLAHCPPRVIGRVASFADEVTFAPGEVLAEQGRSPEWFFLIETGSAEVARDGVPLGVVGPGGHYGEVALLGRGMHPATLRAITAVRAWVIGCQRFSPLVDDVRPIREVLNVSLARQPELLALARAERAKRIRTAPPPRPPGARPWAAGPRFSWRLGRTPAGLPGPPPPPARRVLRAGAVAAVLAAAVGAAALYHPPFAVIRPGPVIDVSHDVVITGAPVHAPHGRYLLLTVRAERPSFLGVVSAALHGGQVERVRASRPDAAAQLRQQLDGQFSQSQRDASAAAAAALGLGAGRLPFTVRFRHHNVVGPSAGLVYALAIDDLLSGVDRAHGRVIAATGAVDAAGDVGPVSYVREKAIGARRAGAEVLLAPTSDAYEAADSGLIVVGVSSVQEALERLAAS